MQSFYVCFYGSVRPFLESNLLLTLKKQNTTGEIQIPASLSPSHRCNICLQRLDSSSGQCKASVYDLEAHVESQPYTGLSNLL